MRAWSAFLPRWVVLLVGIVGWLVAVDALLAYIVAFFLLVTGEAFNPYIGIVLVVVLPLSLAVGVTLSGWAYVLLTGGAAAAEVVAEEVRCEAPAIQGL